MGKIKININDIEWKNKKGYKKSKTVYLEGGGMLAVTEFNPGTEVVPHSHPETQIGYILQGEVKVIVKDKGKEETVVLKKVIFLDLSPI